MTPSEEPTREAQAAWSGVSAAFAALGRAFICVDREFRIIHASAALDDILNPGSAAAAEGRRLLEILGEELFGPAGVLRLALLAGERREGWRAHVRVGDSERVLVSVSAAPFHASADAACDPRVAYVIVLRPAADDGGEGSGGPTAISGFIARSPSMIRIFGLIESLHQSEATVLITGESGTGKEVLARALHEHSPRRGGPFVAVSCGALPGSLLESEIFGHVRGAFTGAVRDRVGRFDAAANGTLFLDEAGDIPLELQVKLLRVLQDGTFERVGENATRQSRARVIAATHVNLVKAVRDGRFRQDLYYRLRVIPIEMPPLRERREDIEPLAWGILSRVGARQGRALRFSPDALRVLMRHDWPGNVRELENAIEYAVAVCRGQTILPEDLPELELASTPSVQGLQPPATQIADPAGAPRSPAPWHASPESVPLGISQDDLRRVLDEHHWRRASAASALGISRSTLWRWMREAGLV